VDAFWKFCFTKKYAFNKEVIDVTKLYYWWYIFRNQMSRSASTAPLNQRSEEWCSTHLQTNELLVKGTNLHRTSLNEIFPDRAMNLWQRAISIITNHDAFIR